MSVFFSRFMGNELQCGTNKSRELRFISHEPRKKDRGSRDFFVPHCDSFPMNREKNRSSRDLFVPHCDSFPMNREKKTLIPYIYNASNKDRF